MKSILLSFIFALSALCCDETNLFNSNKGFASIPVSDQDSIGACYAYVAAQILDTERFDNGVNSKKRTHPLWAAYNYKLKYNSLDKSVEGGTVEGAIKAVDSAGLCIQARAEDLILKYKESSSLSDAEFMDIIESAHSLDILKSINKTSLSKQAKSEMQVCERKLDSSNGQVILANIREDLVAISGKIIPRVVLGQILKTCVENSKFKPRVDITKLKDSRCDECTNSEMQTYILKQLKRNKPVAISYSGKILSKKDNVGVKEASNWNPFDSREIISDKFSGHASILAGSRKRGNSCEFLLKNTWGDWKSSTWKNCLCETSKGKYENCTIEDKKINSVGCWIDAKKLSRNILRTTHF